MKFITIRDPQPYSYTTVHESYKALAHELGAEHRSYEMMSEVANHRMEKDSSSDMVFISEAALIKIAQITIKELRSFFPNAKFVVLGGDSVFYKRGNVQFHREQLLWDKVRGMEFDSPYEVDLFLDLLDEVVEDYLAKGINADSWMWTQCDKNVNYWLARWASEEPVKQIDFIGLFSINNYRQRLIKHLQSSGKKLTLTGSGIGYDQAELYAAYSASRFTLGTTSPSWTNDIRTMKGFRDWIGPACGSVLVYDDHPDVHRKYPDVPTYNYESFAQTLIPMTESIDYEAVLSRQQKWIKENTIERQLKRLLLKHGIIP